MREADTLVRVMRTNDRHRRIDGGAAPPRARKVRSSATFLGSAPFSGAETTILRKTDLVILLTPTVMTPARAAQSVVQEMERLR